MVDTQVRKFKEYEKEEANDEGQHKKGKSTCLRSWESQIITILVCPRADERVHNHALDQHSARNLLSKHYHSLMRQINSHNSIVSGKTSHQVYHN